MHSESTYRPHVIIESGSSESNPIKIADLRPRGLSAWLLGAWTAAAIGFKVSEDETDDPEDITTWSPLLTDADGTVALIKDIATSGGDFRVAPDICWAIGNYRWLKVVSVNQSTPGTLVNQGGDREIILGIME